MLEVFFPFSFVLAAVRVVESTLAVSLANFPVSDVPVPQQLAVSRAIKPDMCAKAALKVVFPVALVLLIACQPVHSALAVPLVASPLTLIVVSTRVGHLSLAPLHASLPLSFVHRPILVRESALSMPHSVEPLALILDTFFRIDVLALAMSEAILDLSFVGGLIWPLVTAAACDFVAPELALVDSAICPGELPLAVEEPVLELALVGVAIPELAGTLAMVNFTNLKDSKILMKHTSWELSENEYSIRPLSRSMRYPFHSIRPAPWRCP